MEQILIAGYARRDFETIRQDAKNIFQDYESDWIEQLLWTTPARAKWLVNRSSDAPYGYPIADTTHILAHRSFVAGFLEGNTSASRPWIRYAHPDPERNRFTPVREWLDLAGHRAQSVLSNSNFYNQAGQFYYDYGAVNTGCHIIKKMGDRIHVYTLLPGSYFVVNNALNEPDMLVREFSLNALALVKRYGKKVNGEWDWSMFSSRIKHLYEKSDTTVMIELVEIFCRNKDYKTDQPIGGKNREWTNVTYETGVQNGTGFSQHNMYGDPLDCNKYLEVGYSRRKPFIVGKSQGDAPYGDKGPTSDAIGLIRSLNKKAISKDIAIEKMLDPTTWGPAHVRKNYLTTQARKYIPLDATAMAQGGLRQLYEMNPAIGALTSDVMDMRQQVDRLYYADFLLYLSSNPKTRTAEEVREIVTEKQSVIGPNLQSLNWSYNMPIAEWVLDFVIHEDPYLPPPPVELEGEYINTEFTSVFASVQRAFDLPQINQYVDRWLGIAQLNPQAWNNINLDTLAKTYEDRYYLPAGLNNSKSMVEALKKQAQQAQMRQQMIEAIPAAAQASKNQAQAEQIRTMGEE